MHKNAGLVDQTESLPIRERIGLYVHIPFCHTKCGYCDFNSYAMQGPIVQAFEDALRREIEQSPYSGSAIDTLFFGGGTPTFLTGDSLTQILELLFKRFEIHPDAEITSEANPGTVDTAKLKTMRKAGFNRLSFGVQSFDAAELKRMERIHSPEEVFTAVMAAREAGFDNLNLDLIYALPDQPLERWHANLLKAIQLQPEHLSLYGLMLEPNTRFYHLYQKGRLRLPDDETQLAMHAFARACAQEHGYQPYEISNYAKLGRECQHNLIYWHNMPYLGFGPGAVSYWEGKRWTNIKHPREYIRRVKEGEPLGFESERLTGWERVAETIMLGLRLEAGIDWEALETRFQLPIRSHYAEVLIALESRGWLQHQNGSARLTEEGFLWHSEAAAAFFEG